MVQGATDAAPHSRSDGCTSGSRSARGGISRGTGSHTPGWRRGWRPRTNVPGTSCTRQRQRRSRREQRAPGRACLRRRGAGRGRCVSIFLEKHRRYIVKCQLKRPPKSTQRPPHQTGDATVEGSAHGGGRIVGCEPEQRCDRRRQPRTALRDERPCGEGHPHGALIQVPGPRQGEIMGSHKYRNAGESQSVLIMYDQSHYLPLHPHYRCRST
jgi:hypothetical protein